MESINQLCWLYNGTLGQVMITPWNPDNTMDMDEVYIQLTLLRDERELDKTTKTEFEDYSEIFSSHQGHPKTIFGKYLFGRRFEI